MAGVARRGRGAVYRWLLLLVLAPLLMLTGGPAHAQGAWLTTAPLPAARTNIAGATAACPSGVAGLSGTCVYAIGGMTGNTVEAFSPATNRWVALPPLPVPRTRVAATTAPCPGLAGLFGNCVYALGGGNDTSAVATVEAYSPATNRWVSLPPLPNARAYMAAGTAPCPPGVTGLTGTCVYASGGSVGLNLAGSTNMVEAYSPATNRWATLRSLPTSHGAGAGAAVPCPHAVLSQQQTCVYVAGGFPGPAQPEENHRKVEAYYPGANVWATLPSLLTIRTLLAGAAAPCPARPAETCFYTFGGTASGVPLDTVESYNPLDNVWSTLPSLPTARSSLAGATAPCPANLNRTCVYAIGGTDAGGNPVPTVEAFDIER